MKGHAERPVWRLLSATPVAALLIRGSGGRRGLGPGAEVFGAGVPGREPFQRRAGEGFSAVAAAFGEAAGVNYRVHVTEMAHARGAEPKFPPAADIGYRASNALVGDGDAIVVPADAGEKVQYEGELVGVIGMWRGKNTDTFKPMGPWIVTGLDPADLSVTIRLNGREMFTYAVRDAIFSMQHYISRMSKYLTLYPGDVLWLGTDGMTENMKDGDVVEIEIPGIGVLRNPVVREKGE